jgi:type II secretory pathway component GspD/PulD (secretin)
MTRSKILPSLAMLVLVSSCDRSEDASSTNTPQTRSYQLEYLQPAETLRALQSLEFDPSVTIRADNEANRIIATFRDPQVGDAIEDLLVQIDVPHIDLPTRFISLEFAEAGAAANQVARHFESAEPPMNILPDVRTNRVFLMGTPEQMDLATAMLEKLDSEGRP